MTYASYILILLLVLTVHEYGHLLSAQVMGLRTARLQIGIGPALYTRYTGRTSFHLKPELPPLPVGRVVEFIAQWSAEGQPMTILAWRRPSSFRQRFTLAARRPPAPYSPTVWNDPPPQTVPYCGRVNGTDGSQAVVSTMAWALSPIPLAAFVALPEATHHDVPNCYNTASLRIKTLVVASGVAANIALFLAVALTLPFLHNPVQAAYQQSTGYEAEQSPYHLRVADTTLRYYRGFEVATKSLIVSPQRPPDYPQPFDDPRTVCGPICAGQMTGAAVQIAGLYGWVTVLGIVTIFTAFLNIIPLPPLDGWKLMLNFAQALRRRPFNPATTMGIEIAAVAFIAVLILVAVVMDLHHQLG